MSKSQKVLRAFGILELLSAIINVVTAIQGGGVSKWLSAVASLLTAYLLFAAAKDAKKIGGAWAVVLLALILSVLDLVFAISGGTGEMVGVAGLGVVLNLIVFIAANNVKKQAKK